MQYQYEWIIYPKLPIQDVKRLDWSSLSSIQSLMSLRCIGYQTTNYKTFSPKHVSVLLRLEATSSEHQSWLRSDCLAVDVVPAVCAHLGVHHEWLVCGWLAPVISHWTQSTGLICPAGHWDLQTPCQILHTSFRQEWRPCSNNHHCRKLSDTIIANLPDTCKYDIMIWYIET